MRGKLIAIFSLILLAVGGYVFFQKQGAAQAERDVRLMQAAVNGTLREVQEALEAGGDPNAAHFGPGGMTPLMFAASANTDGQVITELVKAGAKVDARTAEQETALMFAARRSTSLEVLQALIAAKPTVIDAQDSQGDTALLLAVVHNSNPKIAEEIAARLARIHPADTGGRVAPGAQTRIQPSFSPGKPTHG